MGYEKWEIAQLQSRVRYWNELIMKLIDGLIKIIIIIEYEELKA